MSGELNEWTAEVATGTVSSVSLLFESPGDFVVYVAVSVRNLENNGVLSKPEVRDLVLLDDGAGSQGVGAEVGLE